ncbi:hypothetical protein SLA2020_043920 [Shorea laevis]
MASSNRHWPSMFKSKPCNHHQWQHDINSSLMSTPACHRAPYTSVPGCEERSPEPKPRWNPKPEQIRILEAIFNSGMVNPPRDEIRKIRAQLQEYGQVGDANVFYWFQNRKSRSKHKLRHLQNSKQQSSQIQPQAVAVTTVTASLLENSSSSKVSTNKTPSAAMSSPNIIVDASGSPTASVNQTFFQTPNEFLATEPFFFPVQHGGGGGGAGYAQGYGFSELSNVVHAPDQSIGPCTSLLLSEIIASKKEHDDQEKMKMQLQLSCTVTTAPIAHSIAPPLSATRSNVSNIPPVINHVQGVGEGPSSSAARSTVFINDVAFEVAAGPFNIREAFGDDAVLINSSGQPVLTNEWGVTVQSLEHGAFYYLVRALSPSASFSA